MAKMSEAKVEIEAKKLNVLIMKSYFRLYIISR